MTPEDLVALALEAAEEGLRAGEMPIGAVVALGDEVIGRGFTSERTRGRRLVHADLLAMIEADERLGWSRREQPLRLGITTEPCLMCFGTALTLGVGDLLRPGGPRRRRRGRPRRVAAGRHRRHLLPVARPDRRLPAARVP
ncbi:hypothetical protein Aph02nite_06170 [Actinoplanes philippinensis]|nr:hypothetical protein Aph02nite_06170 [Actinoplanes philippinensis]